MSLPFLIFSITTPTFIFAPPAVPYFTNSPAVFIVTISPTFTTGAELCINLTLSSLSFRLNLDCTLSNAPAKNGEPTIIGSSLWI